MPVEGRSLHRPAQIPTPVSDVVDQHPDTKREDDFRHHGGVGGIQVGTDFGKDQSGCAAPEREVSTAH